MPTSQTVPIHSIADVFDGPHATPQRTKEGPIFLGIDALSKGCIDISASDHVSEEDFVRWTRRILPEPGDIVFSYETRLGEAAIIPAELRCCLGRRMGLLRPKRDKVDPDFLLYAYLGPAFQDIIRARTVHGSTVDRISIKELPNFPIELPSLDEQYRIGTILRALDDKIELNRQINHTLEQMAQAIFQSWFVDFEPVKAKIAALAEGRDPLRAAMCAISGKADAELDALPRDQFDQLAATAALFSEELVESELGEIPVGWEFSTIGQEVSVLGGGTPSTANPEYWDGEFAWVTPRDLSRLSDNVLIDTERRITAEGVRKISSGQLPIGSILLSSRAPIGYLALTMMPVSINQGFIAMVCDKRLPNTYVLQWAFSNLDAIKQRGSGTTFPEISKSNFRPMSVLVPDAQLLAAFQELMWPLYEQVTANIRVITSLANLRDSLLPKLLSGELSVAAIEETASEKILAIDEAASEVAAV